MNSLASPRVPKRRGNAGVNFSALNLATLNGLSVDTRGREGDLVTSRSESNAVTVLLAGTGAVVGIGSVRLPGRGIPRHPGQSGGGPGRNRGGREGTEGGHQGFVCGGSSRELFDSSAKSSCVLTRSPTPPPS
jgi:hypothetical protein